MEYVIVWDTSRWTFASDLDRNNPIYFRNDSYNPIKIVVLPENLSRFINSDIITDNFDYFDEMIAKAVSRRDLIFELARRAKEDLSRFMGLRKGDEMSLEEEGKVGKKRWRLERLERMLLEQSTKVFKDGEKMERIGRRDQKMEMSKRKKVEGRLDKKTTMKRVKGGSVNKRVIQPCG